MSDPVLSIAVCTYNRADLLRGCLQSLAEQTIDASLYEVIVVDNNSTDTTQEIGEEFAKKYPNFRIVREPQQGLSHARNRGWHEATGDYVGFIDDDAKADNAWLQYAHETINALGPEIFGGPYYPFYIGAKPAWMSEELGSMHHEKSGFLKNNQSLSGSNIFFKKSFLNNLGGFNPDLGMKGARLAYGEETALILKALEAGKRIYYCHEMKVYHLVAEYKKNPFWYLISAFSRGGSSDKIHLNDGCRGKEEIIYALITDLDQLIEEIRSCIFAEASDASDFLENRIIERASPLMARLGRASENYKSCLNRESGIEDLLKYVRKTVLSAWKKMIGK